MRVVKIAVLRNWKKRRIDKRTENYWKEQEAKRKLNSYEEYQKEWNFIETEYSDRPSNNGLDLGNPAFAFTTNLAKYIKIVDYDLDEKKVVNED